MPPVDAGCPRQDGTAVGVPPTHSLPNGLPAEAAGNSLRCQSEVLQIVDLGHVNMHAEAGHDRIAQNFVATMAMIGLSQLITGTTHQGGHTLHLIKVAGDLMGGAFVKTPHSPSLPGGLTRMQCLCVGGTFTGPARGD